MARSLLRSFALAMGYGLALSEFVSFPYLTTRRSKFQFAVSLKLRAQKATRMSASVTRSIQATSTVALPSLRITVVSQVPPE
jgi:hypothetical protein